MEMIYAALLLHSTGKKIDEEHIKKVIEATGEKADPAMMKALVSSLKDVNIDEAIKQSSFMPVAAAPEAKEVKAEKKEEKKEDESKKAEEAAAGLSSLFG